MKSKSYHLPLVLTGETTLWIFHHQHSRLLNDDKNKITASINIAMFFITKIFYCHTHLEESMIGILSEFQWKAASTSKWTSSRGSSLHTQDSSFNSNKTLIFNHVNDWLIHCLTDWLIDWLIDGIYENIGWTWLFDWLINWLNTPFPRGSKRFQAFANSALSLERSFLTCFLE